MDLVIKIPMFIILGLIVVSLGEALFFLAKDDGKDDRTRMVRALTVRISLSLLLFALLIAGHFFGLAGPAAG